MRVAVLSDIHGSLVALNAVIADLRQSAPDIVVHGGDLVVNGPRPDEVATTIREMGWAGVVGNTDEMLWKLDGLPTQLERMPQFESLLRVLYVHTAPAALERLSDVNLDWLKTLPSRFAHDDITLIHASPDDLWRAPAPQATDEELVTTYEPLAARVIVYGHIHRPFVRQVHEVTFANSGSVGLTWDHDPRASYLLINGGVPTIRRVEYDVDAEIHALVDSQLPFAAWLAEMRRHGAFIPPDHFEP
jgi:putative phosphoesterase